MKFTECTKFTDDWLVLFRSKTRTVLFNPVGLLPEDLINLSETPDYMRRFHYFLSRLLKL